jgi:hypothetical protein
MAVRRLPLRIVLLACAMAAVSSCGDSSPAGVDVGQPALAKGGRWNSSGGETSSAGAGLVACAQTYDSVTQVIGPAGGLIAVGPHFLWVDTMVLSEPVAITAVAPTDTLRWVHFEPDGLEFRTNGAGYSALLYTNYKDCGVPSSDSLRIAQVTGNMQVISYLETFVQVRKRAWSQGNQYVAGWLHHFSQYAISW